ncbi:hypothetical protein AOX59_06415 [Lentibacillus amyloliquefaciens]|uniref:DUF3953 domain-containing protein n=2 Tax=Lentibacillus amyloliquefaciens TaxID=1472767 RepID=A0A0U4FPG4_9BACI|nr:hypothetical protein AOX59_06415 [Lentibacillus amyloliquefaciens]
MLITKDFEFIPYLALVVGITFLITGVVELKEDKRAFSGYMSIIVSLFIFFASILGFVLN